MHCRNTQFLGALFMTVLCGGCGGGGAFTLEDTTRLQYDVATGDRIEKPFSIIHMRERWPVGVPLHIGVSTPENFTDRDSWRRITVSPRIPDASDVTISQHPNSVRMSMAQRAWSPGLHRVGFLPKGATEIEFGISAEEKIAGIWIPLEKAILRRAVAQVPTIDDVTFPVTDPRLTVLLQRDLVLDIVDGREELRWGFPPKALAHEIKSGPATPTPDDRASVAGISFALRVSFHNHGAEVAFTQFFISQADSFIGAAIEGDFAALRQGLTNPEGWTVVIESDPEMALLDLAHDRYWAGRFERPMSTLTFKPKPQMR